MDSASLKKNIVRARRNNPCATLQELGNRFGVTRERVRQVLLQEGKPTSAYRQTYLCNQCGKDMGVKARWRKFFCSERCYHDYTHIQVACSYCGELNEYSISLLVWRLKHGQHSSDLFFCSKCCHGKWLAEKHGFSAYPEHIPSGASYRKWDYTKIYELRDKTGWGTTRISRALGIPESTISVILRKRSKGLT